MAVHGLDLLGVKLVEGGVIQDQNAAILVNEGLDLLVESFGIGFEPEEQPGVRVVSWRVVRKRLAASRFTTTRDARSCDQEVDVRDILAFRLRHDPRVAHMAQERNLYKKSSSA